MLQKCGFLTSWRRRISSYLSSVSMPVPVNGSPTDQFSVSIGIRLGDPMAPFLFLLVAEGFSQIGLFEGYRLGRSQVEVSILQYAYDTVLVCKPTTENLWCLKSIVHCFELVSRLKMNAMKSAFFGVKVDLKFIYVSSNFLSYSIGCLPFKYLGIPVGAFQRKSSTWALVIEAVASISAYWRKTHFFWWSGDSKKCGISKHSYLSSFSIQSSKKGDFESCESSKEILVGWQSGGKGVAWVSWSEVCKPKLLTVLGLKTFRLLTWLCLVNENEDF
ncbi:unnamed protein product [Lupinus luteus]|uniref:Reverse transcriptase domain-containing protein n=1 Tax=Lupinus luteus TaxID=3873 RepID=A0AAV1W6W3_LUPLU